MDVLLPAVLLVGIATLAVAVSSLRSSRRSENLGEDRHELLRDQHDRLEMMREEVGSSVSFLYSQLPYPPRIGLPAKCRSGGSVPTTEEVGSLGAVAHTKQLIGDAQMLLHG
jgi:hypothetical protein